MTNPPTKTFGSNWARLISTEDDWQDECKETTPTAFATTQRAPLENIYSTTP